TGSAPSRSSSATAARGRWCWTAARAWCSAGATSSAASSGSRPSSARASPASCIASKPWTCATPTVLPCAGRRAPRKIPSLNGAGMARKTDKNLIVGLDIGTSKVVAIVGEISPDGEIEIIGLGSSRSRGLKKGVVVNIESTVHSIQRAVEEAELMAGCEIHSVYAGIAGSHIRSLNSHGIVAIRDNEVTMGDVDRVIDAARAVAIPADQKILHILPQEVVTDNQEAIRAPVRL